ncbi:MAG: hypothetical protein ACLU37_03925 [Collinsella sp.]
MATRSDLFERPVIAFDLYDTVDSLSPISHALRAFSQTVTAYGSRLERFAAWCEREVSMLSLPTCAPFAALSCRAFA